ncbi:MAG: hypothetical protein ACREO8_07080 [Luteimonas sp.]
MIRQIFIATVAALALSGCISDYAYRDGPGDYYYGRPSTEYYEGYGAPYGSIGYGGYGNGYYGGGYGYPYGYNGGGYGYPRYYHPPYNNRPHRPDYGNNPGYYNRNAHGSDKIPGIIERNRGRQPAPGVGQIRQRPELRVRDSRPPPQLQRPVRTGPVLPPRGFGRDPSSSRPSAPLPQAGRAPVRTGPALPRPQTRAVTTPTPRQVRGRDFGRNQER